MFEPNCSSRVIDRREIFAAGILTKRAGKKAFPDATWAGDEQISLGTDPVARAELEEEDTVEAASSLIIDIRETGIMAQPCLAPNTPLKPSSACFFQPPINFGWILCLAPSSDSVRSPRIASNATFALKSELYRFLVVFMPAS